MKNKEIIASARKRLARAYEAEAQNRIESLDDLNCITGKGLWTEEAKAEREAEGKPCLNLNSLPQYVRQVTGQIRGLNPSIKVVAGDSAATKEGAEVVEGLIRHIESKSNAVSIYEASGESAAMGGFGAFRVMTEYADDVSFNQEIRIGRIHNSFAVYFDPEAKEPTRSDAEWCMITEKMQVEDFKEAYNDMPVQDVEHQSDPGWSHWVTGETVTVAEYFWKEYDESTIWELPGGQIVENVPDGLKATRSRKVRTPRVMWAKVSGSDVLDGPTEFPSKYIPVIAVTGEEIHIGEDRYISSVIRHSKDAMRLVNYDRSAHAELVALQPKAPYMVTGKQVAGYEEFWNEANRKNRPYLPYNADPNAPPPMRVPPPISSQGLMQETQLAYEDLKRTTGIYDAGLGAKSNETSGVAINARKQESQNSTSIYADNTVKAVEQCGRILVDMIPRVYDAKRTIVILGEDDQQTILTVNDILEGSDGVVPLNDLTLGKYAVKIGVGPNYSTKRQESAEGMMAFVQAVPAAAAVTGDLIAKSQDWPDADRFAERLKKMLPPGVDDEGDDATPEQKQARQAQQMQAQQEQQRQQETIMKAEEIKMREESAKAAKAQADAEKAQFEARLKELELGVASGQLIQVTQPQQ